MKFFLFFIDVAKFLIFHVSNKSLNKLIIKQIKLAQNSNQYLMIKELVLLIIDLIFPLAKY